MQHEFRFTPPAAPAADPQAALNALWAFVAGIGLDPAAVLRAYADQEAGALGVAVGRLHAHLASESARALLKPFQ